MRRHIDEFAARAFVSPLLAANQVIQLRPRVTFPAPGANLQERNQCDEFHEVGTKVVSVRFVAEERDDMRTTAARSIPITHRSSGEDIAEGPLGFWAITPFEGNLYISRKCLKTCYLRPNWVPGLCIYICTSGSICDSPMERGSPLSDGCIGCRTRCCRLLR